MAPCFHAGTKSTSSFALELSVLNQPINYKQNTRFTDLYFCVKLTWVVHILVLFQIRPMLSHINGKLSPKTLNPDQPKVYGVKFSSREIGTIFLH